MNVPTQYQITGDGATAIVGSVERGVASGRLPPCTRLPTIRALARRLEVSLGTVAAAYRRLQARGVIVSDGRRGTIVRRAPALYRSVQSAVAVEIPSGARNLADGNPDPALLPSLVKALRAVPREAVLYGNEAHDPRLVERAAKSFRDDAIPPTSLAVIHGALDGIERALSIALRNGDKVAVEDPIYPAHLDLLGALGLEPLAVEVDARGIRPEALSRALRRGARALIVTPRAQNPTGAAFDPDRRDALRAVLDDYPAAMVIEDDHAWRIAGVPYYTLVDGRERWFAVRSFSKAFGPDLRVAVAAGDPLTIARVKGRQQLGVGWVSHVSQSIVVALWNDPATRALIERTRATYAARRNAFVGALASEGIAIETPSGLNCWIPVRDEAAAISALRDAGYVVAPGARFRIAAPPAIRITISRLATRDAPALARAVASTQRVASITRTA